MSVICNIRLQPGIYLDPAVNIYYHRTISFRGNCSAPNAVIFRATKPGTKLIWIQDHAIGMVACLTMDSESTGTIGIAGRQHIIAECPHRDSRAANRQLLGAPSSKRLC
jgi:hypothetical protein